MTIKISFGDNQPKVQRPYEPIGGGHYKQSTNQKGFQAGFSGLGIPDEILDELGEKLRQVLLSHQHQFMEFTELSRNGDDELKAIGLTYIDINQIESINIQPINAAKIHTQEVREIRMKNGGMYLVQQEGLKVYPITHFFDMEQ